jgi:DeoR family transcriptional regulator of aga operon
LIRARGGAMKFEGRMGMDYGITEKDRIHIEEKRSIGKFSASLVEDGEIIIIDSGTTTVEFAKSIDHLENITVITNALNIALVLAHKNNINLIIPGGFMRKNSQSLVGPMAEKSIANFNVDKLFLGVDGIDVNNGLFTPNLEEAHLNELMIRVSKEVIVLTDSSKFNKRSFAFICGMDKVNRVVTDKKIKEEDYNRLIEMGIEVSLV